MKIPIWILSVSIVMVLAIPWSYYFINNQFNLCIPIMILQVMFVIIAFTIPEDKVLAYTAQKESTK